MTLKMSGPRFGSDIEMLGCEDRFQPNGGTVDVCRCFASCRKVNGRHYFNSSNNQMVNLNDLRLLKQTDSSVETFIKLNHNLFISKHGH